ncbi:MAG: alanine--tRNA ligase [Oscillospiraceae bacterium]|jgi:alanyl-tRNA synthetase|nr:alanine--tRNA ligase [Oscillospiraceae bacterium]
MEWTGLNQLREQYLAFFESKGHLRLPSFSLVPQGDASLLLINSGMAPMKKYFTYEVVPPRDRVTTCQKCIRTPDIENVGMTARHGTYFEMLGNFSFGDYFKREATAWAWEFFTQVIRFDPGLLYISVFEEDDEAFDIWTKEVGVPNDHMVRLGRGDNFWEHGKGPCGPCSEIYYDRGARYGCGSPDCKPGCDCDRFMEIWNLVFTQFNSDGEGHYDRLERCNIDTGMGLERLACVVQGVDNLFEVDTVQNIMKHIIKIAGVPYHEDQKKDVSLRVITDHIRSTTMMVGDGVLPSNEGRGYVLRRLLRRAARHGRLLGVERPFLSEVAATVIRENESAYPQLREKQDFIWKVIANEEENFSRTIDSGLQLLEKMMADTAGAVLGGADAFKLSDTYGFPIDLTKEILAEHNMTVDEPAFQALVREQRERSRKARLESGVGGWDSEAALDTAGLPATEFLGYSQETGEAVILAILTENGRVDHLNLDDLPGGEPYALVLNQSPFYAESGGQCGDSGTILVNGVRIPVSQTIKTHDGVFLHYSGAPEPSEEAALRVISVGVPVACAQVLHRPAIRANHTAAHLLQAALRQVLGSHVEQAGQSVTPAGVRFDFTHFAALTHDELNKVERLVNEAIWQAIPVTTEVLPIEEAKARGAMALFGEKYGDTVRMVSVGDVSKELCGGTHAANTGNLGAFLIQSESSVASGVRRIEAVTAGGAHAAYHQKKNAIARAAQILKANSAADLETRAQAVMTQLKSTEQALAAAQEALSAYAVRELLAQASEVGGVRFVSGALASPETLRQACDAARQSGGSIVALFAAATAKGTLQFAAAASPQAVAAGAHAGNLVRAAAQTAGGSGGGKPDSAMAGGKDPAKLQDALAAGKAALSAMLSKSSSR